MNEPWDAQKLLEPIAADKPCGDDLEATGVLSGLDAYQIFGQTSLEPEEREPGEPVRKEIRKSDRPPKWIEIRDMSVQALATSKDLRALAYLGASLLQTDGIAALLETYGVASEWLNTYWADLYPRPDEDLMVRASALDCMADPVAIIDQLRRAPIVAHRQHGKVSLRDFDVLAGKVDVGKGSRPDEAQVNTAFAETPIEELRRLREGVGRAAAAVSGIEARWRQEPTATSMPTFEPLLEQLARLERALGGQVALHPSATAEEKGASGEGSTGDAAAGAQGVALGAVKSREDAIRALDAVASYFRRTEPSSPIPLFVERAKRLVAKDFLDVLADIAPDALAQARQAGGVKSSD